MQTHAFADAGFQIPPRPARARRVGATSDAGAVLAHARTGTGRWLAGLGPVQQLSLGGILGLLTSWGLAELALLLGGF